MHQTFNPQDWLQSDSRSDIELVVYRIEASHTDITGSYADWRNIGFALADEFGEGGRDFFHRISKFYAKYSLTDCNNQFDQCLKSQGHGITIKTVFHLAKQAGVEIGRLGGGGVEQTACSTPPAPCPQPLAPSPGAGADSIAHVSRLGIRCSS